MILLLQGASLNSGNRGVNALTRGFLEICEKVAPESEVKLLSYSTQKKLDHQIAFINQSKVIVELPVKWRESLLILLLGPFFFSILKNFFSKETKNYESELSRSDYILDLSEGDSFSDIYGMKRMILHSVFKLIAIRWGKKLILLPQTYGPYKGMAAKIMAKYICRKSWVVLSRDEESISLIRQITKNRIQPRLCEDLAFHLKPILGTEEKCPDYKLKIGINVSGLLWSSSKISENTYKLETDYRTLILQILLFLIKRKDLDIVLVPHVITKRNHYEDDISAIKELFSLLPDEKEINVYVIDAEKNEGELKGIISKCHLFLGSRMHACIAAASMSVPTIPLAYSKKFKGVWKTLGFENSVVDLSNCSLVEITDKISETLKNREWFVQILKDRNVEIRENILRQIGNVLN